MLFGFRTTTRETIAALFAVLALGITVANSSVSGFVGSATNILGPTACAATRGRLAVSASNNRPELITTRDGRRSDWNSNHDRRHRLCVANHHRPALASKRIWRTPSSRGTRARTWTRKWGYRWSSELHSAAAAIEPPPPVRITTTAVYALILASALSFVGDNILGLSFFRRNLYLCHWKWKWWQPLTSTFCHGDRAHLSGNAFLLLLFGRSVEDELGAFGLVFSYVFCGVVANLVSLVMLPSNTVSIGASGAVFGLFSVSILARLSWRDVFDWRKIIEVGVLGQFVVSQFLSEAKTAASGGIVGINHVAHLSGAAAGCAMVLLLRLLIRIMENNNTKTNY